MLLRLCSFLAQSCQMMYYPDVGYNDLREVSHHRCSQGQNHALLILTNIDYCLWSFRLMVSPFTTPRMRGAEGQGPNGPQRKWMC